MHHGLKIFSILLNPRPNISLVQNYFPHVFSYLSLKLCLCAFLDVLFVPALPAGCIFFPCITSALSISISTILHCSSKHNMVL